MVAVNNTSFLGRWNYGSLLESCGICICLSYVKVIFHGYPKGSDLLSFVWLFR